MVIFSPNCNILFTRDEIDNSLNRIAHELNRTYESKYPLLVCVLKGAFMFIADLTRRLHFPLEIEFIQLASYGSQQESSGKFQLIQGLHIPIQDRDVLVIEDIIDTGLTLTYLLDHLRNYQPASLKICVLADKPARRQVPVNTDFVGFTVPDKFLVGYGLDYGEKYRNLPDIYVLEVS